MDAWGATKKIKKIECLGLGLDCSLRCQRAGKSIGPSGWDEHSVKQNGAWTNLGLDQSN